MRTRVQTAKLGLLLVDEEKMSLIEDNCLRIILYVEKIVLNLHFHV